MKLEKERRLLSLERIIAKKERVLNMHERTGVLADTNRMGTPLRKVSKC